MSDKQRNLYVNHGGPREFAAACNRAADSLEITTAECETAIEKYQREWDAAADEPIAHRADMQTVVV